MAASWAVPCRAQLRPVGGLDWDVFDSARALNIGIGLGYIQDQQASLAGTRGDLLEMGNFRVAARSGRIGVEFSGTLHRRFSDETVIRPPAPGTDVPTGEVRHDAGDILAATAVRINDASSPVQLALRFGTRLPTTSNEPGLDRDRTDFFMSFGGRYRFGRLRLFGESGLAILGTRTSDIDQLDVMTYAFGVETRVGPVSVNGSVVGQDDWHIHRVRGNEDLGEFRLRVRTSGRWWISATAIRGIAEFSPRYGIQLMAGRR